MSINVIGKYVLNPANMTLYIKNENAKTNNGNIEIFFMIRNTKINFEISLHNHIGPKFGM